MNSKWSWFYTVLAMTAEAYLALLPPIESSNLVGEPKIVGQQRLAGVG
ncbi:hypothetical protein NC651_014461 [Populus alba x Populus x berolinensis]|nr:hypothetical protein NC651_014461 [Populus alba x Populus x berolinensis]